MLCARRNVGFDESDIIEFVSVNTNGVQLLDGPRLPLFGQDIAVGPGSLRLDYPDVSVAGTLQADGRTVAGGGAKPIISFDASLEQLIPVVGALLSQAAGPFEVTLLSVDGGPVFSLYQDFKLEVLPRVTLIFDTLVEWVRDGVAVLTNVIDAALGETIVWRPLVGASTQIEVQTIFTPQARITNDTGFAIGFNLDVDALEVGTAFGDLGPIDVAELNEPAVIRLPPLFSDTFDLDLPSVNLAPVTLTVASRNAVTLGDVGFRLSDYTLLDDLGRARLTLVDGLGEGYIVEVDGREVLVANGVDDGTQTVFIADDRVELDTARYGGVDLGRLFCAQCDDASVLFASVSPSFVDGGERLYLPDLSIFRRDTVDFAGNPNLNRDNYGPVQPGVVTIGAIERFGVDPAAVPVAPVLALLGIGLVGMGVGGLGRRRRG